MGGASGNPSGSKRIVLHLSQSQIATDPRILRAMDWGRQAGFTVKAIGVEDLTVPLPSGGEGIIDLRWRFRATIFGKSLGSLVVGWRMLTGSLRAHPNIIHCHQYYVLPVAFLVSLLLKTRIVYDAHELESMSSGRGKGGTFAVRKIEQLCSKRFAAIITVCEEISDWYEQEFPHLTVREIYNIPAFDPSRDVSSIEAEVLRHQGECDAEVLYIGRTGDDRATKHLLEAQRLRDSSIGVSFLGWSPSSQVVEEGDELVEGVRYLGAADHRDVVQIAQHFDVGVVLLDVTSVSYRNALPNKFWELAYSGIPILASRTTAIERLAAYLPNVMVVDEVLENPKDLVAAIRSAARLGKRGVAEIPPQYTQSEMVRRLVEIYELSCTS